MKALKFVPAGFEFGTGLFATENSKFHRKVSPWFYFILNVLNPFSNLIGPRKGVNSHSLRERLLKASDKGLNMNGFIKESFHPTVGAERRKLERGFWTFLIMFAKFR